MSRTARALVLFAPVVGLALAASPAGAGGNDYEKGEVVAQLAPIPGNGVEGGGHAEVEFARNGQIDEFEVVAQGLLADHPHAVHIHFGEEARHECPTLMDDTDGNGRLNTTEGAPAYGPVQVSLTTRGDTSAASVLAIDRFDTATNGTIDYEREERLKTDREIAAAIAAGKGVVVVHGVDHNGNGVYDFGAGTSDLDPTLPTEATDPALCGVLEQQHDEGSDHGHDDMDKHEH